ncbi:MAG: ABC-F family ATP-binding cassette domain-containing protein [Planctomycetota bacterium]|nr:ABC-F family ATP-binding cassette domain-containing protein [Planctomycetota bacterium]
MAILIVSDLKRQFGAKEVLAGASLQVERGDKIGIVGRNGEGKTTLLRHVEGEEKPDSGKVQIAKGARMAYVRQSPSFAPGETVRAYVETGLDAVHELQAELAHLEQLMCEVEGDKLDSILHQHGEKSERMEFLGGWDADHRIESVMHGIGLDPALWDREARTLSGGEKSRTALARELVSAPDLLLLDEPTNHLDLEGIEWLEAYLKDLKSAVVIVSHDRRLLNRAVTKIVELEHGKTNSYPGNYSKYLALKEERFEVAFREWKQQSEHIRKEENFIKKHMGSQRTAEAKGRQKKLSHIVRVSQPHHDVRRPRLKLKQVARGGEMVFEGLQLDVGYDGVPLLSGVDVRLGRGDRLGIVGPNGAGKTTLLKVLASMMEPLGGELRFGHKAIVGYYDQNTSHLDDAESVYEHVRIRYPQMTHLEIRSHLAQFLFRGSEVDAVVGQLSGGERARVALALLMLESPSWLAMDEPTNHLDLAARTAIEEFLASFPGAIITISHDREFLDALCNQVLEVRSDGTARQLPGNYTDWRNVLAEERDAEGSAKQEQRDREKQVARKAAEKQAAPKKSKANKSSKAGGAKPAKASSGGSKRVRNPWAFEKLEADIEALETERDRLLAEMQKEENYKDASRMTDLQYRQAEVERDLEEKNETWANWE